MSKSRSAVDTELRDPFPRTAIKQHPERRNLTYVEGHTYINKIIAATDNTYDWRIVRIDSVPFGTTSKGTPKTLVTVTGELTIAGFGTRAGVGVQVVVDGAGEDMLKGANTDAIKAAAKLFGVGLELYGEDYISGEIPNSAPQQIQPRQQPAASRVTTPALPDETGELITEEGRRALEAARAEKNFTHDDMKAMAAKRYGVSSSKDLTIAQGRDFWNYLKGLPPKPTSEQQADIDDFNRRHPPQQAEIIPQNRAQQARS